MPTAIDFFRIKQELEQKNERIAALETEADKLAQERDDFRGQLQGWEEKIERRNKRIEALNNEVYDLESTIRDFERIEGLSFDSQAVVKELKDLSSDVYRLASDLDYFLEMKMPDKIKIANNSNEYRFSPEALKEFKMHAGMFFKDLNFIAEQLYKTTVAIQEAEEYYG